MADNVIKIHSVLHATDFSAESERAFAHALKAAVDEQGGLVIMHVGQGHDHAPHWSQFPGVRSMLERWGLLEAGSQQRDVYERAGLSVEKVAAEGGSVSGAVLGFLERHSVDLLVLATHGREGLPRWIMPSVAEPIARQAHVPTLFVPHHARGFVSTEDGSVSLRRVLVPVDHEPLPQLGVKGAEMALHAFGATEVEIALLYVGKEGDMPQVRLPDDPRWSWTRATCPGKPVDEILAVADASNVDLIVMATAGHQGFWDVLRGSTTEQVLRHATCPVLAVPAV